MEKLIIGLTGGIGSGKSTVSEKCKEMGYTIVDTDKIAHDLTAESGLAMKEIELAFGAEIISDDGSLNRSKMRERILRDPKDKSLLESILHPMIFNESLKQFEEAKSSIVILDVPLLAQSEKFQKICNRILVVDCDEDIQIARVKARNGWSEDQIKKMISSQSSREDRLKIADDVLINNGSKEEFEEKIELFFSLM